MNTDTAAEYTPRVETPPAIALAELRPWLLFGLALLLLVYFVGFDEGATALTPGRFVHELVHDGRHLLAFPCH
ncbi:CbtB domain-containing protein [Thermoleophilum album]|uniref:Cobalt transporter subunit CbtB n=1 Tax=Thermoleophilum album TaxID=29539 RepID=A0A1H6FPJ1_THEAL|nr:CbtB domain-containing protein [Thermoleophilum album]SEH12839.1 cobalt transporter subunit CbtB [Thermoleophilum album]